MFTVCVEAPTRIDLAGGTLDINPLYHILDRPITVNVGIDLDAKVLVRPSEDGIFKFNSIDQGLTCEGDYQTITKVKTLPLFSMLLEEFWEEDWPSLELEVSCKSPAGAGLGGSSCLAIAFSSALQHTAQKIGLREIDDEYDLVQRVQAVETKLIRCPTGCQDYWGAVRGRLNILSFGAGGVTVDTVSPKEVSYLSDRSIVCFSGKSRASGMNNWSIFKQVFDGDEDLLMKLNHIGSLSSRVAEAIKSADWERVLGLSIEEWQLRRDLWPEIETLETKTIDEAARKAGAKLSRICGAGGGGVMAIFAEPSVREQVIREVEAVGGEILDANISEQGVRVSVQDIQ